MKPRAILYVAFACSGAAALIYEITWTRLLTLFMGHTVAAAGTVLAAFMGGLALGAAIAGRVAPAWTSAAALRVYAGLEVSIAVLALLLPVGLDLFRPLLAATYDDGNGGAAFGLTRWLCALVVVTVPAFAMGATLPAAIRWHASSSNRAGWDTGVLYAANTIGATTGAVVAGFVLIPTIGMRMTTLAGVALNGISAGLGLILSRQSIELAPSVASGSIPIRTTRTSSRRAPATTAESASAPRLAMAALGLSGCLSLMLQLSWTRLLALLVGPTTYAFTAIVATFIGGIALGSMLGAWASMRGAIVSWLTGALVVAAVASSVAALAAPEMALLVGDAVSAPGATFGSVVRFQCVVIAGLMLPMTVALGTTFPLGVALATQGGAAALISRSAARVYTANTIGAIIGALLGAFILIPRFGLESTIRAAGVLAVLGAVAVSIGHTRRPRAMARTVSVAAIVLTAVVLAPQWDRALLASGAYKYASYLDATHRRQLLSAGTLLYYREGATATVSVKALTGTVLLAIDGKIDASNAGDMLTQRLLAHLPLLLHPAPQKVAIIGLGSGVTLGSALRHSIARADVIEISPEVVEASRFFAREHHNALADPRARLIVGDGRAHLALGRTQYDVIISEPSNPWMAGVAALFTREFFEAAKARLAPDGLLCQWAHTYEMSDADLRSIAATMASVFPEVSLWLVGAGDALFIASRTSIEARLTTIHEAWARPGVAADLMDVDVRDPKSLLTLFAGGTAAIRTYAGRAPRQLDAEMRLEFSAPRGIYGGGGASAAAALRHLSDERELPQAVQEAAHEAGVWAHRGAMDLRAEAFDRATDDWMRAADRDLFSFNLTDLEGLLRSGAAAGRVSDVETLLKRALAARPTYAPAAIGLSRLRASSGEFSQAVAVVQPLFAGAVATDRVALLEQWASVLADAGDAPGLATVVLQLQQLAPASDGTLYYTAVLHTLSDRPSEAVLTAERLRAQNPRYSKGLNLLGTAYGRLGRVEDARRAFEAAILADPRDPTPYLNLGDLELRAGRVDRAAEILAEALTLDPHSGLVRESLDMALAALRGR